MRHLRLSGRYLLLARRCLGLGIGCTGCYGAKPSTCMGFDLVGPVLVFLSLDHDCRFVLLFGGSWLGFSLVCCLYLPRHIFSVFPDWHLESALVGTGKKLV